MQIEIQEILFKYQEATFSARVVEQVAQKCYGISAFGDIQNTTEHASEQPALVDPSVGQVLYQRIPRGALPPQLFYDAVPLFAFRV